MERTSSRVGRSVCRAAVLIGVLAVALPAQASPYAYRGVIFGPYGRPWSHQDRVDLVTWMGGHGMNIYVHAAKDDRYQRAQWRDSYPQDLLGQYAAEIAAASAAGVQWVPNLSPGVPEIPSPTLPMGLPSLDVCFSCAGDVAVIVAKLRPLYDLGVRTFMISFDDVLKISTHLEDLLGFGLGDQAYGVMTATLLQHVLSALEAIEPGDQGVHLITVPADYSGTSPTPYLTGFGATLGKSDRIRVMWTGTAVVSHAIAAADAKLYRQAIWGADLTDAPKLLAWDNFPANDYDGNILSGLGLPTGLKLNMGPYKGRKSDLVAELDGILANPMNEAQASKIPLFTVARYLDDPAPYTSDAYGNGAAACPFDSDKTVNDTAGCRAEQDWLDGVADFGGPLAAPLLDFVRQIRSTPLDRTESPLFVNRWTTFRDAFSTPLWMDAWAALETELGTEAAAPAVLRSSFANAEFLDEARNQLAALADAASAGLLATDMLSAERPAILDARAIAGSTSGTVTVRGMAAPSDPLLAVRLEVELLALEALVRTNPYGVYGDRFAQDLANVYIAENRMDDYLSFAHEATAQWLLTALLASEGPLTVTVNDGAATPVGSDGTFEVTGPAASTVNVVVTDAAGFRTGKVVPNP